MSQPPDVDGWRHADRAVRVLRLVVYAVAFVGFIGSFLAEGAQADVFRHMAQAGIIIFFLIDLPFDVIARHRRRRSQNEITRGLTKLQRASSDLAHR